MDYIKRTIEISRPIFWPSTFLIFILGIIFSRNPITPLTLFFAFLWSFPYSLWICTVNDLADTATDSLNEFKGGISGTKINSNETHLLRKLQALSFTSIIIPVALTFNYLFIIFSIIALLIPYLYSAHPFRLKERPPMDSLSNGLFVIAVFVTGYVFNKFVFLEPLFVKAVLALFCGVSSLHIIGALRDYTPDKQTNTKTIAVSWGQRPSTFFALILFLFVFILVQVFPVEFRLFAVGGIIVNLFLFLKPSEHMSFRLGMGLLVGFFIIAGYSILFNSWINYF